MIKGAQRKMIVMKTAESNMFEEAYFVMRRGVDCSESDMVSEANRIIENYGCKRKESFWNKKRELLKSLWIFLSGCAVGSAIIGGFLLFA